MTDPAGRVHRYSYDPSGNLAIYTDPMGGTITYEYDGLSWMTRATDQNGHLLMDNSYDVWGRVVEQHDVFDHLTSLGTTRWPGGRG